MLSRMAGHLVLYTLNFLSTMPTSNWLVSLWLTKLDSGFRVAAAIDEHYETGSDQTHQLFSNLKAAFEGGSGRGHNPDHCRSSVISCWGWSNLTRQMVLEMAIFLLLRI